MDLQLYSKQNTVLLFVICVLSFFNGQHSLRSHALITRQIAAGNMFPRRAASISSSASCCMKLFSSTAGDPPGGRLMRALAGRKILNKRMLAEGLLNAPETQKGVVVAEKEGSNKKTKPVMASVEQTTLKPKPQRAAAPRAERPPEPQPDRPFTLPPGDFRPKQSLGQNFLSDQNYVLKIVNEFREDPSPLADMKGGSIVEIGPGPGSLTRVLFPRYPDMMAIEIDQRAIRFLAEKLPGMKIVHMDVLDADWPLLAAERGEPLNIIANLPYYIVSQVLFMFADAHKAIRKAVVTSQLEVAERIVAKPSTKAYGILSVVFQLYSTPKLNFKIPPTVFYPQPKVDSALVTLDFTRPHPRCHEVDPYYLKKVIRATFGKRRKMIRSSLKELLAADGLTLSDKWANMRPEQLRPEEFIDLTLELYGQRRNPEAAEIATGGEGARGKYFSGPRVWRAGNESALSDEV